MKILWKYPHSLEKKLFRLLLKLIRASALDFSFSMCYNLLMKLLLKYKIRAMQKFKAKPDKKDTAKVQELVLNGIKFIKKIKEAEIPKEKEKTASAMKARLMTGEHYSTTIKAILERQDNTLFKWHTQQDDRVRPKHQAKEGNIYDKHADILPGEEPGCRCWGTFYVKGKDTDKFIIIE